MSSYLEDTHLFSTNTINYMKKQNHIMKIIQNINDKKQLSSYHFDCNDIISIDLDEEKEKKDKEFKINFHEVFPLKNDNFDFNSHIEDNNKDYNGNNKEFNYKNKKYEDIFYLVNIKGNYQERSLGRLKKNIIPLYEVKKDKFDKNNIMQKIIRHLIMLALTLINKTYEGNNSGKKSEPFLRSINAEEYNVYSNQKIYKFFNKTLGEVFSADISKRNSNFLRTHPKDYNKKKIESLKNENKEKNMIELLNLTVKELHEKYIKDEIPGINFEKDLIQIKKKTWNRL